MAQQSARRGWDNQGFPLCFEHALGDLDPVRELHTGRRLSSCRIQGRTDDSIRPRAATIPTFSLAWKGASTDGKAAFPIWPAGEIHPSKGSLRPEAPTPNTAPI